MAKKETVVEKKKRKKLAPPPEGIFVVAVNTLKFFENNPKKFTSKQFGRLLRSIKEEGILEPLMVNKLTNTVLNGNQRLKGAMQLGITEVKVQYMNVEEADEGYFVAIFNKTLADQDDDAMAVILKKYEEQSDLIKDFLADYEESVKKQMAGQTSEYEIVREIDESYNYVCFVTKKSVDHINIETFFNLSRVYDPHKSKLIGMGRIVDGEALNRLINLAVAQGYKNINEL
jgi:hypothetical protein